MTNQFRPLLSAKVFAGTPDQTAKNLALIKFPTLVSVKWDGWRMFEYNGEARCRSMKPPKNYFVQRELGGFYKEIKKYMGLTGIDGEILVGDPYHPNVMQATSSGCNSYEGEPEFNYQMFDTYQYSTKPFYRRLEEIQSLVHQFSDMYGFAKMTEHWTVNDVDELLKTLDRVVAQGGEGIMGRDPEGHYKMGRSSMKEGILWALKPYMDDEAEIIGFAEELENQNVQTVNELGYSSRSGHKENLVGKNRLGKFICRSKNFVEEFSVGAGIGLTHALRQHIWDHQDLYLGKILKYKYQAIGVKERPRQPKFIGFREAEDME